MTEPTPEEFDKEIRKLQPLSEDERIQFAGKVRDELPGKHVVSSYEHREDKIQIIFNKLPGEGTTTVQILDQSQEGRNRLTTLRVAGPAVAVESRIVLSDRGFHEIDSGDDLSEVRYGDVAPCDDFFEHRDRYIEIERR